MVGEGGEEEGNPGWLLGLVAGFFLFQFSSIALAVPCIETGSFFNNIQKKKTFSPLLLAKFTDK